MTHRLINVVLLVAYGLPAIVGHGLHWLLPDAQATTCQACSCGHQHAPAVPEKDPAGRRSPQSAVSAEHGRSTHDCESCPICKQQRLAQLGTSAPPDLSEAPLVDCWLPIVSCAPRSVSPRAALPRAPPA